MLRVFLVTISLFSVQPLVASGDQWIRLKAAHFELYTQIDEQHARQALQIFEQARAFFLQTNFGSKLGDDSITILDLASETAYKGYVLKPGAYACYQRGRRGDYIVMRDLNTRYEEIAVHEYTHFMLERAGLKLPIWLNEGIAEFYATVEPHGAQWLAGRAQAGRLHVLETQGRLRLETLFSVDGASPYYNDPEKMQIFYAESWALTHMLAASPAYYAHFGTFLSAISSGKSENAAFELAWGKDVASVEADLDRYLRQRSLSGLLYETKTQASDSAPQLAALSREDLDLSFADLLSSNPYAAPGIEQKLIELSRKHPDDPGFEELLGYLALHEKRAELAQSHFANAVERQSKDPVAIYNSARLQQSSGASAAQVIPLLERALELNPDYIPARMDLGFTAAKANQFELAASTLSALKTLDSNVAFEVYFTIAYCDLRLNRLQDAATYAAAAQQNARTFDEEHQVSTMIRIIDGRQVSAIQ